MTSSLKQVIFLTLIISIGAQQQYNGQNRPQQGDSFSTRRPPNGPPGSTSTTAKPPTFFNERFDDRDSSTFRQTLTYDQEISDSMEKFSLEMFHTFLRNERLENKNFMISPFTIYNLLCIISEGAGGDTLDELLDKLQIRQDKFPRARDFQQYLNFYINKTNAELYLKKFNLLVTDRFRPIKNEFESVAEKTYDALVEPVDFTRTEETLDYINGIVSAKTGGQINDAVNRDSLLKAQLILISGLYFKGAWKNVFNVTDTRNDKFHDINGKHIANVPMMFQRNPIAFSVIKEIASYALEMEYAEPQIPATTSRVEGAYGKGISMIILLPKKGQTLESTIEKVYSYSMQKIFRDLYRAKVDYGDEEVEVYLPKFEIETDLNLKDHLEEFGISEIFDQNKANLRKINPNYYISAMVHKTKISVDERGTVASAVASAIFTNKSTPPKFQANRPFLYFIVDKWTNLILFSGQYVGPNN